jgi:hypothetical protein
MAKKLFKSCLTLASLVAIVIGFRFVTQAGQGLGVIQNDGYGASGGVLILLGGIAIGYLAKTKR